jgi:hypothetical protein
MTARRSSVPARIRTMAGSRSRGGGARLRVLRDPVTRLGSDSPTGDPAQRRLGLYSRRCADGGHGLGTRRGRVGWGAAGRASRQTASAAAIVVRWSWRVAARRGTARVHTSTLQRPTESFSREGRRNWAAQMRSSRLPTLRPTKSGGRRSRVMIRSKPS